MQRSAFIRNTAITATGLLLFNKKLAAAFFQQPAWKIKMLTDDIGIFTERGGTIAFYISKKGIAVVDAQFPDQSQHLIDELKKKSEKPFKFLINTHHHGDHTAGNISFKGIVEHVVAHANSLANQKATAEKSKNEDKQLFPDTTYTDKWTAKLGKEKISMHYFGAGHTNGDSLVHFEHANIVHLGDLLFNRRHPYVDKNAGAHMGNWITVGPFDNENRGGQYVPPAAFLSWNGDCADGEAHERTSDSHPHDDPEGENEISKDLEDVPNEPRCYSEERSSCGCSHE